MVATVALSVVYALIALAAFLIVFLVICRLKGLGLGLMAGALAFIGMLTMYVGMAAFITSQMP